MDGRGRMDGPRTDGPRAFTRKHSPSPKCSAQFYGHGLRIADDPTFTCRLMFGAAFPPYSSCLNVGADIHLS